MKQLIILALILFSSQLYSQVVFPEEAQIEPKAELKVYSTDKGVLIPRMAGLEMLSIKEPATGLWIYNTSNEGFYHYNGNTWQQMEKTQTDPGVSPFYNGQIYFDETTEKIKFWDGAAWVSIGTL